MFRSRFKTNGLAAVLAVVDSHTSDDDVVRLAISLLNQQNGHLYILYVIEVDRDFPVDAEIAPETVKGEGVLQRSQELASSHKVNVQAGILQARRAGLAVVQEAMEKGVDAIVLGVPYESVPGVSIVEASTDVATYVLKNAPCRVILWRDVVPEKI